MGRPEMIQAIHPGPQTSINYHLNNDRLGLFLEESCTDSCWPFRRLCTIILLCPLAKIELTAVNFCYVVVRREPSAKKLIILTIRGV